MLLHVGHDHPPAAPLEHEHSPEAERAQAWAMRASIGAAVLMLVGKGWAFSLTGSTAILSDALESVIHLGATAMAGFSLWYARQPADRRHPYGHGKIAYFSSGVEGALIMVAGLAIAWQAVLALIDGPELQNLGAGLAITAALAVVNLVLGLYLIRTGKRTNALVLEANGHHVLTDMWTSLGVLVGVALVLITRLEWLDPLVALAMGLNILWTSGRLIRAAVRGLMDVADDAETERVLEVLAEATEIDGFHHVRHRRVNDRVFLEQHLLLDDDLSLEEAHRRCSAVEARQRALFPESRVQITSHLEPVSHEHAEGVPHDAVVDGLARPER